MHRYKILALITLSTLLAACEQSNQSTSTDTTASSSSAASATAETAPQFGNVSQERLNAAANEPEQWMTHGGTYSEQRYSKLDQINKENINQVGLSWFADLETNRGQQSTPLYVDGMIYVTESWSKVSAFDASTGERKWFFDPQVPGGYGGRGCCDVVNRGVAVYEGSVFVSSYDGRLFALDAGTGEVEWETDTVIDRKLNLTSSGAPRAANGLVFIGNGGAEYISRGYMSAYDTNTGELKWRFFTVPGNPADGFESDALKMAADTWTGEWWTFGGGGTTWDAITYDPETNLVIFGVGNGSPWNPLIRSPEGGDNLFTVSIVAVDADTGEYAWHFQEIPADEWDFDAVQQVVIADLEIDGEMRHVAMQAAKNGYYYMLDANTGKLLRANNFVSVNWTSGYDMETGRPNINEFAQYTKSEKARVIQPGPAGAHNWQPISYSPRTGLLYFSALESSMAFTSTPDSSLGAFSLFVSFFGGDYAYEDPKNKVKPGNSSRLIAWDPIAAKEVWGVENVQIGGTLSTASDIVFKGNGGDANLAAYDAVTGQELWKADTQAGAAAGIITYSHNGEQHIAHVVGGSAQGGYYAPTYARLLVYKVGGTAQLPEKAEFTRRPFAPPEETATEELVAMGAVAYGNNCGMCHGDGGNNRGMFPDIRRTPMLHTAEGFKQVVLEGILESRGMVSFAETVSTEEADAIRHYLIAQAHIAMNAPNPFATPIVTPDNGEQ